jgi:tetratricopeptide (TPR) repeat protein
MMQRIKVLLMLRRGFLARRAEHLDDARNYFAQAVSISRRIGSKRLLVRALKGCAQIERDSGRPAESLPYYEEAVSHCREIGDRMWLAHTIRHLGDANQDVDELSRAEECYREALSLYRRSRSVRLGDLANAVRPFAILKERLGDRSAAIELWTEAHELYSSIKMQAGIDESASHIEKLRA